MDELIPTRATLIQRLKNWDDQSSWQDFFDTYWKLIYRVALKGGLNEAEAHDVVQETMVSVAKHMPAFKYDPVLGSFKAWLLNLTRWRITDQFRRRGPLPVQPNAATETGTITDPLDRVMDPASQELDRVWEEEWEKNLLQSAIVRVKQRLDPQKFQIFDLYVNKGIDPNKVADAFGISIGQVYLAKHRVTDLIKEEVRRLEAEVT